MKTDHQNGKISSLKNLDYLKTTPNGQFFDGLRGWGDLEGHETALPSGGAVPSRVQLRTGVYGNFFDVGDTFDTTYHLRHLIAKDGTNEKFAHIHVGIPSGATASGDSYQIDVVLGHLKLYSAGRNMSEIATITKSFIATTADLNAAAGNTILMGGDTLIAQNGGGAGLWNCSATGDSSEIWLPDDIIVMSGTVITTPTVSGGVSNSVITLRRDIHEEWLFGGSPKRIATSNSFWG